MCLKGRWSLVALLIAFSVNFATPKVMFRTQLDLLQQSETVCETGCQVSTVMEINQNLFGALHELVQTTFFRYFKVNLNRRCPFWKNDGMCMNRDCAVTEADEREIPEQWKSANLSKVDTGLGFFGENVGGLHQLCDDKDFCVIEPEHGNGGSYVNLALNPERFTGYSGESANKVWSSIYKENCFDVTNPLLEANDPLTALDGACLEKRVFYRLISGLHTSISIHICSEYLDQKTGHWYPNLSCYVYRVGKYPERLKNLYFMYTVVLTALHKWGDYLTRYDYCSGNTTEDKLITDGIRNLIGTVRSYPKPFDETVLFKDVNSEQYFDSMRPGRVGLKMELATSKLLDEFKLKFRNISAIMDCVSCEKCRLWGKVQTQGLGTAMKMLFSFSESDKNVYKLNRAELLTLLNTFHRLSESLNAVQMFEGMWLKRMNRTNFANSDTDGPPTLHGQHLHVKETVEAVIDSESPLEASEVAEVTKFPVVVVPTATNFPVVATDQSESAPHPTVEIEHIVHTTTEQPFPTTASPSAQILESVHSLSASNTPKALEEKSIHTYTSHTFVEQVSRDLSDKESSLRVTSAPPAVQTPVLSESLTTVYKVSPKETLVSSPDGSTYTKFSQSQASPTVQSADTASTFEPVRKSGGSKNAENHEEFFGGESVTEAGGSSEPDWVEMFWEYAIHFGKLATARLEAAHAKALHAAKAHGPQWLERGREYGQELYQIFRSKASIQNAVEKSPVKVIKYGLGAAVGLVTALLAVLLVLAQFFSFMQTCVRCCCCGFCFCKLFRRSDGNMMGRVSPDLQGAAKTSLERSNRLHRRTPTPPVDVGPTQPVAPTAVGATPITEPPKFLAPATQSSNSVSFGNSSEGFRSRRAVKPVHFEDVSISGGKPLPSGDMRTASNSTGSIHGQYAAAASHSVLSNSSASQSGTNVKALPVSEKVAYKESFGTITPTLVDRSQRAIDGKDQAVRGDAISPLRNFGLEPSSKLQLTQQLSGQDFSAAVPPRTGGQALAGPPVEKSTALSAAPEGSKTSSPVKLREASDERSSDGQIPRSASYTQGIPTFSHSQSVNAPPHDFSGVYKSNSMFGAKLKSFSRSSNANVAADLQSSREAPPEQQSVTWQPVPGQAAPSQVIPGSLTASGGGIASTLPVVPGNVAAASAQRPLTGPTARSTHETWQQSWTAGAVQGVPSDNQWKASSGQASTQSISQAAGKAGKPSFGVNVVSSVFDSEVDPRSGNFAQTTSANPWGNLIRRASAKGTKYLGGTLDMSVEPTELGGVEYGADSSIATGEAVVDAPPIVRSSLPFNGALVHESSESALPDQRARRPFGRPDSSASLSSGVSGLGSVQSSSAIQGMNFLQRPSITNSISSQSLHAPASGSRHNFGSTVNVNALQSTGDRNFSPDRNARVNVSAAPVSNIPSRRSSGYGAVSPNSFGVSYHTNPNHTNPALSTAVSSNSLVGPAKSNEQLSGTTSPYGENHTTVSNFSGEGNPGGSRNASAQRFQQQYIQGGNFESTDSLTSFQV